VAVEVLEELGSDAHVFFQVDAPRMTAEVLEATEEEASLLAQEKALFNARVDPRTRGRVGEPLQLAVDPARFHFFDPDTGDSLLAAARAEEASEAEERLPLAR
jgi:multiple sugar transport system ATP-binding protein